MAVSYQMSVHTFHLCAQTLYQWETCLSISITHPCVWFAHLLGIFGNVIILCGSIHITQYS